MRPAALALLILLSAIVARADAQASRRGCPAVTVDSTADTLPVFVACQVDRAVRQRGRTPRIQWQPSPGDIEPGACFFAEFEFVVDTLGLPEPLTIKALRTNNPSFESAVLEVVEVLRYEPARRGGAKVRQVTTFRQTAAMMVQVSTGPVPSASGSPRPVGRRPTC